MNSALFGTDGIRGTVGAGLFTPENILRMGHAIGRWVCDTYGVSRPVFIIYDTRVSSPDIAHAITTALSAYDIWVIDGGVLPTGAAWHVGRMLDASCALVISASHNPPHDNGIKIIDCAYGKLTHDAEQMITKLFEQDRCMATRAPRIEAIDAVTLYSDSLCGLFPAQLLAGKKIVLDCAEGAMSGCAPAIFTRLGAEVILRASSGNGTRINVDCGATAPRGLASAVLQERADIGCAFDGDGDRLIIVSSTGDVLDGDDLLVYLSGHPRYAETREVVGSVLANGAVAELLAQKNKLLRRVVVGDRAIAQALSSCAQYGGEPSGHYLFADKGPLSDGSISALTFLEECVRTSVWSWRPIDRFPAQSISLPVSVKKDLTVDPIAACIAEAESLLIPGRLVVRYSGTEPLLRVFAEAREAHQLNTVLEKLTKKLIRELT